MIKVDIEFDVSEGARGKIIPEDLRYEMESSGYDSEGRAVEREKYQYVANEKLKIRSISKPYIEHFNYD
jgi:hypothetical protein